MNIKIKNDSGKRQFVWLKVANEIFYEISLLEKDKAGSETELAPKLTTADRFYDYSKIDFKNVKKDSKVLLVIGLRDPDNNPIDTDAEIVVTDDVLPKKRTSVALDPEPEPEELPLDLDIIDAEVKRGHILSFRADPRVKKVQVSVENDKGAEIISTPVTLKRTKKPLEDGLAEFKVKVLDLRPIKKANPLDIKVKNKYSLAIIDEDDDLGEWVEADSTEVDPSEPVPDPANKESDGVGISLWTLVWILLALLAVAAIAFFFGRNIAKPAGEEKKPVAVSETKEPAASVELQRQMAELHNYMVGLGDRFSGTSNHLASIADRLVTSKMEQVKKQESVASDAPSTTMSNGTNLLKSYEHINITATNGSGIQVIGPINGPVTINGQTHTSGGAKAKPARPFHKKPSGSEELLPESERCKNVSSYKRDVTVQPHSDWEFTFPTDWRVVPQPSYGENIECFYQLKLDDSPENPNWVNIRDYDEEIHGRVKSIHIVNKGDLAFTMTYKIYPPKS